MLVTEEFLEYVQEDALSVEVWGHRSSGLDDGDEASSDPGICLPARDLLAGKQQKSLQERWTEVTRRVELWVDVQELNEQGEYGSVDVTPLEDEPSAGVYQLRQVRVDEFSDRAITE